jgi:hypothetical protein
LQPKITKQSEKRSFFKTSFKLSPVTRKLGFIRIHNHGNDTTRSLKNKRRNGERRIHDMALPEQVQDPDPRLPTRSPGLQHEIRTVQRGWIIRKQDLEISLPVSIRIPTLQ